MDGQGCVSPERPWDNMRARSERKRRRKDRQLQAYEDGLALTRDHRSWMSLIVPSHGPPGNVRVVIRSRVGTTRHRAEWSEIGNYVFRVAFCARESRSSLLAALGHY